MRTDRASMNNVTNDDRSNGRPNGEELEQIAQQRNGFFLQFLRGVRVDKRFKLREHFLLHLFHRLLILLLLK